ncbi:helix-turn-helix domain-containing protein [Nonomuraea sp. NBC_00507]|uniref:helix-turn-helix domain-containing protein n=1 Tax=Nonomuraea sp. NBC_00507 TaxID=2976002 RepID=UPI002E197478
MADGSPTVYRRRLVAELRRRREAVGLSGPQVATELKWSTSKISRLENGQILPNAKDVEALLDLYEMPEPDRSQLLDLVPLSSAPEWWEKYSESIPDGYIRFLGFESAAAERWEWQSLVIPGQLQTEAYAGAVIGAALGELTPRQIRRRIELRMARRERYMQDPSLTSKVVLDESVLRRKFGNESIMSEQLHHLREVAERPNIELQVLLNSQGPPVLAQSFILLRFPTFENLGELHPDVLYVETEQGGGVDEDEMRTHRHLVAFKKISEAALSPQDTMSFIENQGKRWTTV